MDYDDWYMLYVALFMFSLIMLLFTSYNFKEIVPLVIIYGMMIVTTLCVFHAFGSAHEIESSRTDDKNI